jgi:hypothetical protein
MKTPSPNRPRKRRSLLGQCSFRNELSIEERIEILNTDINMPDIDGYAMAKYAITRKFEGNNLSGRESDGRGFPLIRKPFMQDDLRRTMAQHTGLC